VNATTVTIDAADAIELAEICELLDGWLAADPAAAASYDNHIGQPGQAAGLRRDLRRLAGVFTGRPEAAR
jgi:predicted ATPase